MIVLAGSAANFAQRYAFTCVCLWAYVHNFCECRPPHFESRDKIPIHFNGSGLQLKRPSSRERSKSVLAGRNKCWIQLIDIITEENDRPPQNSYFSRNTFLEHKQAQF